MYIYATRFSLNLANSVYFKKHFVILTIGNASKNLYFAFIEDPLLFISSVYVYGSLTQPIGVSQDI